MPDFPTEETLFEAALQFECEAEREDFVERECGADRVLRDRVFGLLRGYEIAKALEVAPPIQDLMDGLTLSDGDSLAEAPGTLIGRYKLLQQIGEGGFGVVFLAEQQEPVVRLVALKVIKLGMDTRQVVARFEAERQALALMDHPNIAKVLDGGATETGRPYFVMELVKGVPITHYCDENKLSIDDRLTLFMPVCKAIQHAHQKGIIHRDLKPTNVMVTRHDGVPVPKVIDFGVSKAINQRLTERTLFTEYAQMVGTPAYMSPEQAEMSGLDVDTRSDIYSLGVLLYELLTGTTPHDAKKMASVAYGEMQRIIREVEPPKPSIRSTEIRRSVVTDSRHKSNFPKGTIARELDWIVMKALEKDRRRRYENASEITEDIERYTRKEPVKAGAPGWTYRAGRFVRRHRTPVLTSAAILSAIVTVSAISFTTIREERNLALDAEADAEREAAISKAANEFLNEYILASADPFKLPKKRDLTLLQVLDRAASTVEERFGAQPEVKAEIQLTLSQTYAELGAFDEADVLGKAALEGYIKLYGDTDVRVLRIYLELAEIQLGWGKHAESLAYSQRALSGFIKVFGLEHSETIMASNCVAKASESKIAEIQLHKNVDLLSRTLGQDHQATFDAESDLAFVLFKQGTPEKLAEAMEIGDKAHAKMQRLYGDKSRRTILALAFRGAILAKQEDWEDAALIQGEALARARQVWGETDPMTVTFLNRYSLTLIELERFEEAIPLIEESLSLLPPFSSQMRDSSKVRAEMTHHLCETFQRLRRNEEAIALLEELLESGAPVLPDGYLWDSENFLAELYAEKKEHHKVLALRQKTYEDFLRLKGADSEDAVRSKHWFIWAHVVMKQFEEAEGLLREMIDQAMKNPNTGLREQYLPWALYHLGCALHEQDKHEESISVLRQVLDLSAEGLSPDGIEVLEKAKSQVRSSEWMPAESEED